MKVKTFDELKLKIAIKLSEPIVKKYIKHLENTTKNQKRELEEKIKEEEQP